MNGWVFTTAGLLRIAEMWRTGVAPTNFRLGLYNAISTPVPVYDM